jgi:hypothetical protein
MRNMKQQRTIMKYIKMIGEEFRDERVVKTEIFVQVKPEDDLYYITPTFYVKNESSFPSSFYRHLLSQIIEDYVGVSVYCASNIIIEV